MKKHTEHGQALVETAIIIPLFIFILLGILQMGLVYQSKVLLKYAAYRAARTGALVHGSPAAMTASAMAVMLPVIGDGRGNTNLRIFSVDTYKEAYQKLDLINLRFLIRSFGFPLMRTVVCQPTTGTLNKGSGKYETKRLNNEYDFDAPENVLFSSSDQFSRTRLRIQLQYHQQLIIPFANVIIFRCFMGLNQNKILRMQTKNSPVVASKNLIDYAYLYLMASTWKRYFLPMNENYSFRMQSNLYRNYIPKNNLCINQGKDRSL